MTAYKKNVNPNTAIENRISFIIPGLYLVLVLISSLIFSIPCYAGASRSFDGTDDEIDMGNVHDVSTGDVSIGIWVKATEDASFDRYFGKRTGANGAGYAVGQSSSDPNTMAAYDGTDNAIASGTDTDAVWTFVSGTYVGGTQTAELFQDAVSVDTTTNIAVGSITNAVSLQAGETSNDSEDMAGLLAYAFVWPGTVMTQQQMAEVMWKPDMMELASGFWPFWGDATEIDLSAGAVGGTVSNATVSTDGPPVFIGGPAI